MWESLSAYVFSSRSASAPCGTFVLSSALAPLGACALQSADKKALYDATPNVIALLNVLYTNIFDIQTVYLYEGE